MDVETQPPLAPAMNGGNPPAPTAAVAGLEDGGQPAEVQQQQQPPPQQEQQQEGQDGKPPPLAAEALPLPAPLEEAKSAGAAPAWAPPQNEEDKRMLKCDHFGCPLWVHAQCERLSPEEYDVVCQDDNHPLSRSVLRARPFVVSARVPT